MHKVYFITGKGGVGKSTMAAFFARREALMGKKTLLVEMGPWSYYEKWWGGSRPATFNPQRTSYGFDWSMWTGEDCLKEYVSYLVKVPFLSRIFLENNWMKALIKIAPGIREIAFLGKVTSQIRSHGPAMDYDSIVVDAVSTGHFISLLQAPLGLRDMAKMGPVHEQSVQILNALNSEVVETFLVTTLETFAVQETSELVTSLKKQVRSQITVLANKDVRYPELTPAILEKYQNPQRTIVDEISLLKKHQDKNRTELDGAYSRLYKVPFYYHPLLEQMNDDTEIQRIYSGL